MWYKVGYDKSVFSMGSLIFACRGIFFLFLVHPTGNTSVFQQKLQGSHISTITYTYAVTMCHNPNTAALTFSAAEYDLFPQENM